MLARGELVLARGELGLAQGEATQARGESKVRVGLLGESPVSTEQSLNAALVASLH